MTISTIEHLASYELSDFYASILEIDTTTALLEVDHVWVKLTEADLEFMLQSIRSNKFKVVE